MGKLHELIKEHCINVNDVCAEEYYSKLDIYEERHWRDPPWVSFPYEPDPADDRTNEEYIKEKYSHFAGATIEEYYESQHKKEFEAIIEKAQSSDLPKNEINGIIKSLESRIKNSKSNRPYTALNRTINRNRIKYESQFVALEYEMEKRKLLKEKEEKRKEFIEAFKGKGKERGYER